MVMILGDSKVNIIRDPGQTVDQIKGINRKNQKEIILLRKDTAVKASISRGTNFLKMF